MADVFISYSRADGDFVRELHAFLTSRGKDVWIDWEDIAPAAQWEEDIDDNIDAAESVVFVISGSSLASRYALDELRHAEERGKRIVPLACDGADPAAAPEGLRQLNWIWCRPGDDRSAAFATVLRALDTDLAWAEEHTRLLVRAVEWDKRRDPSLLLRGRDLEEAFQQLAANAGKEPVPTDLQREYLLASRRASTRRQRLVLGGVSLALVVSVALGVVALVQRNLANERARAARSQAFAAQAVAALATDPAAALADAVRAVETHRTPEARVALRRAILANPVAYSIPSEEETAAGTRFDALAFGDAGRTLAGLEPDGVLRLWESATGKETAATRATAFALDGRLLVAARARDARVLDVRTGEVVHTLRAPRGGRVVDVGASHGRAHAAVAVRRRVILESVPAGRSVRLDLRPVRGLRVAFAARSDRVVTFAEAARARVWDAASGRLLARLPVARTAVLSPDGRFVATVDEVGSATLWSVETAARVADLGRAEGVLFSRDARLVVAVGGYGAAGVWRAATGRQVAALPGFGSVEAGFEGATVFSEFSPGAAFSDDGGLVALANGDGNVRIWDVAARKQVGSVGTGWANALAFAPRGGTLTAMAWNGEVVVARAPASVPLRTRFRPSSCEPDFEPIPSPDGRHVLARTARGAGVWTLDGRRVATLAPPARPTGARTVGSAAVSGDGRTVAAASAPRFCVQYRFEAHGAAVWRIGRSAPLRELRAGEPVALDATGRLVAAGGGLWPAAGGARVTGLGNVLVLSPDGSRALVAREGRLEVAETSSGAAVAALRDAEPLREELDLVLDDASFSADGRRLLTGWGGANARLWDAVSGEPIALLGRRGEEVESFGFGDGGRLALATFTGRAAVFSADDGELLSSVAGSFAGGVLSADGAFAAAPGADGTVEVTELATRTGAAVQTDTAARLTDVAFGPAAEVIVARDVQGDVHVVRCEICAPEDALLELARARLAVVARVAARPPSFAAVG